jgi:hypothetical protein
MTVFQVFSEFCIHKSQETRALLHDIYLSWLVLPKHELSAIITHVSLSYEFLNQNFSCIRITKQEVFCATSMLDFYS